MVVKKRLKGFFFKVLNKLKLEQIQVCSVCFAKVTYSKLPNVYLEKFIKHNLNYSISQFETLNIKQYSCNNCGASDRDRLMALYLNDFFAKNNKILNVVDFAPSTPLKKFITRFKLNYRTADLFMEEVDDKIDIRDMKIYNNNIFDIFICSHVLEHIDDDISAMKELYRILKKNGVGVLLVPIMLSIEKSVEDKEHLTTEHLRWKYFGQDDHVRMYSKNDFVKRLTSVGFKVSQYGNEFFGNSKFKKAGIDLKSVLYVVEK